MAELRAKKPVPAPNRLKALIYGDKGSGKTHFACSFPSVYYIDAEGVLNYKKFVNMLLSNDSLAVELSELSEIIKEVKTLLSVQHDYKTLVIDSITEPYAALCNMETERLIAASSKPIEGTEFGANLSKAKRMIFHLGMLLSRLDMNVIVLAQEKIKYENKTEIGKMADINEKMGYTLGTVIHMRLQGGSRKAFVEKTRYSELETSELIDVTNGYEVFKQRFGEEVFLRNSDVEVLATKEQVNELKNLIENLSVPDEVSQKWLIASKATKFDEMKLNHIQACIDKLNKKLKGENK